MTIFVAFVGPLTPSGKFVELAPCFDDRYRPSNMLTDNSREYYLDGGLCSHWLAKNDYIGPGFVYESSSAVHITGFSLRNTASAHGNDRGTDGYKLLASLDGQDFREIHSGNLPDARNKFPSTPCVKVELDQPVLAKFIRFDVVSFFGLGPGLHYFKAHCDLFN